jgi:hypothetical protein
MCCLFERHGYGCCHILFVLRRELTGYLSFEAEDVSVHWCSLYYHFGERPQISQDITLMLRELHRQGISGPMLPHLETIMDDWPPTAVEVLAPQFMEKPACQHVTNYITAHIEGLVKKCNVSTVGLNLSQISVNYCSDIDSDHVDYDLTGASTGDEGELESDSEFGKTIAEKGQPSWKEAYSLTQDSQECVCIDFPPPEMQSNWKETNAFQAVSPFTKEYLDLLELDPDKESKIESLVSMMSDLVTFHIWEHTHHILH